MLRSLVLFLCSMCFASICNAQMIDVPLGEEEFVGYPATVPYSWCTLGPAYVTDGLAPDFLIRDGKVYFKPTRLGIQRDTMEVIAYPKDPDDFHCYPSGSRQFYAAIGVPDTFVRVRPRNQERILKPSFSDKAYVDTFMYSFENTLSRESIIGGWKLDSLPANRYKLTAFDESFQEISQLTLLPNSGVRKVTFVLQLKSGPYWSEVRFADRLISKVNNGVDSTFSNPLVFRLQALAKDQVIKAQFDKVVLSIETGSLDSIQVKYFIHPLIERLDFAVPYPFSVASTRTSADTILATIYCGPSVSGKFTGSIKAYMLWSGFSDNSSVDSVVNSIEASISKIRMFPDTFRWSGDLGDAPSLYTAVVRKPSFKYFLVTPPSFIKVVSFLPGVDSVRINAASSAELFGRYRDSLVISYTVVTRDGKARKDSVAIFIDFDLHSDLWVQTGWTSPDFIDGISASRTDTVYIASDDKLFRSTDLGDTWQLFKKFNQRIHQFHSTGKGGVGVFFGDQSAMYVSPLGEIIDLAPLTIPQSKVGPQRVLNLDACDDEVSIVSVTDYGYWHYIVSDQPEFRLDTIIFCRGMSKISKSRHDESPTLFSQSEYCDRLFPLDWHKPILSQLGSFFGGDENGLKRYRNGVLTTLYKKKLLSLSGKNNRLAAIVDDTLLYFTSDEVAHIPALRLEGKKLRLTTLSDSIVYLVTDDNRVIRSGRKGEKQAVTLPASSAVSHIYPNPSTHEISLPEFPDNSEATIVDLFGRRVKTTILSGARSISLLDVPSGTYFIEIKSSEDKLLFRSKFVKH